MEIQLSQLQQQQQQQQRLLKTFPLHFEWPPDILKLCSLMHIAIMIQLEEWALLIARGTVKLKNSLRCVSYIRNLDQ